MSARALAGRRMLLGRAKGGPLGHFLRRGDGRDVAYCPTEPVGGFRDYEYRVLNRVSIKRGVGGSLRIAHGKLPICPSCWKVAANGGA